MCAKPRSLIWDILKNAPRDLHLRIIFLIVALFVLSLSQGILIALLEPLMRVIFALDTSNDFMPFKSLIPDHLHSYLTDLEYQVKIEHVLLGIPAGLFIAGFVRSVTTYIYQNQLSAISLQVANIYRSRLFANAMQLSFIQFLAKSPAQWMSLIMNDVLYLQLRFSDFVGSFIKDGTVMLSAIITLLFVQPQAALFIAILAPLIAFGMGRTGKRIGGFARIYQDHLALMADAVLDIRQRFGFIRAHRSKDVELKTFQEINNLYFHTVKKSLFVRSAFAPAMEFLGFALFSIIIWLSLHWQLAKELSANKVIVFFAAVGIMLRPLRNIGEQLAKYSETKGALAHSLEVMQAIEKHNYQHVRALSVPAVEAFFCEIAEIKIAYEEAKMAFSASSLQLTSKKTIAVVGPSGAGKSTLIKALAGLIRPQVFAANLSWEEVWDQSFFVSQKPFLFAGTLRENLHYGLDEVTEDKIWQSLTKLGLKQNIKDLVDGLDEPLAGIEHAFSGGQLQRLVLARGLMSEKPLKLYDEVTSAVDASMEAQIVSEIIEVTRLSKQCLVMVTHRLDHLHLFDEVWFIQDGSLMYKGHHRELMQIPRYSQFLETTKKP